MKMPNGVSALGFVFKLYVGLAAIGYGVYLLLK
jgi:hypothetical protein